MPERNQDHLKLRVETIEAVALAACLQRPPVAACVLHEVQAESILTEWVRNAWRASQAVWRDCGEITPVGLQVYGQGKPDDVNRLADMDAGKLAPAQILDQLRKVHAFRATQREFRAAARAMNSVPLHGMEGEQTVTGITDRVHGIISAIRVENETGLIGAHTEEGFEYLVSQESEMGISTGVRDLDERIGGYKPEAVTLICAHSGHGKSSLALTGAMLAAIEGKSVLYVSVEMGMREMMLRLAACRLKQKISELRYFGRTEAEETRKRFIEAVDLPITVECESLHIDSIAGMVDRARLRGEPYSMVVLDYVQHLRGEGSSQHERFEYVSRGIKALAVRNHCAVLALAQPNRTLSEIELPDMGSIRGSSAFANDADNMIAMRRMEGDPDEHHHLELGIPKARSGISGTLQSKTSYFLGAGTFRVYQVDSTVEEFSAPVQKPANNRWGWQATTSETIR